MCRLWMPAVIGSMFTYTNSNVTKTIEPKTCRLAMISKLGSHTFLIASLSSTTIKMCRLAMSIDVRKRKVWLGIDCKGLEVAHATCVLSGRKFLICNFLSTTFKFIVVVILGTGLFAHIKGMLVNY